MFRELDDLLPFLENPRVKIHVREYAKLNSLAPATASSKLKGFAKSSILKQEIVQNIHFYTLANTQLTKDLKIFYTIQKIRQIIPLLNEHFGKPTIVLFGSTAKGENDENSDIDLYIESEVQSEISRKKLEKVIKQALQLFVYAKLSDVPNPHLRQSILNGIVLQGEIRWT